MAANVGSAGIAPDDDQTKSFSLSQKNAAALTAGGRRRRSRKYRGGEFLQSIEKVVPDYSVAEAQLPLLQAARQTGGNDPSAMVSAAMRQLPLLQATSQKGGNTGATVNLASTRSVVTPGASQPQPGVSGKPLEDLAPVSGGAVILRSKKSKISLKAPKKLHINPSAITRKVRKIKVGVKGLKTRLNRAKKAHAHAQTIPIASIKQRLVKAGVIKGTTKAPDHMLRTMYADLLVTKKGL
jgi:hypothetical protein